MKGIVQYDNLLGVNGKYLINKYGDVISLSRSKPLKTYHDKKGSFIMIQGKKKYIHRLLANQYILNDNGYFCVNHIDGNIYNNSLNNLEWKLH